MTYILNIETATTNCSVSLSKDGETLVLKEDSSPDYSHAETLHLYIQDVVEQAELKLRDLNAIAVSKGPGSYTGLRIGVSAAKGLCFSLGIPLISVSTLKSLACQVHVEEGFIVPMLDARRMEVYASVFDFKHEEVREIRAEILNESSYSEFLTQQKVYFVGNGVEKTQRLIKHPNAIFIEGKLPSAQEMSPLAYEKHKKNDIEDVAYFDPYYLKDFIALKPKS
ncbi:MAG: tRNA (adenosine(37)-N6)-threonylcarbamoyltransferase complex dimerization subunit type 1 TsaB [Mangrovimonas sp.]|nr:tRNA (adenosine(37)-N6)-threonylcarbamoyltransferase complex dimerization subunit type 1 TsaB [Mangrovimonas sp.]